MEVMREVYGIIGCGGHARSVADTILYNDKQSKLVFFDDNARENETIFGIYPVMDLRQNLELLRNAKAIVLGIGDNAERQKMAEELTSILKDETIFTEMISGNSYLGNGVKVGRGSFVSGFVHLGPQVKIGNFSIINTGAVIEHECSIGQYSHISVNTTICGRCNIGNNSFIGAGAVVKDKINICDNVIVGAGGVVVRDITEPGTYVGNPIKRVNSI